MKEFILLRIKISFILIFGNFYKILFWRLYAINHEYEKRSDAFSFFLLEFKHVHNLLHDNAQPHVARMTLLSDFVTSTIFLWSLPHRLPFFKHLDTFWNQKIFRSKGEVQTTFNVSLVSKPLKFCYNSELLLIKILVLLTSSLLLYSLRFSR